MPIPYHRSWPLVAALVLTGCASLPADRGLNRSVELAVQRGLAAPDPADADPTSTLLSRPLSAADAVTLALIRNPDTRRVAAELGLAAADVYDAGRLSNPVLSFSRLTSNDPAAVVAETSLGIAVRFTDLLFLRSRSRTAGQQFEARQYAVARALQVLAAQVEQDWLALVAAEQQLAVQRQIATAAQVSSDLAERFHRAGNLTRRALTLEQAAAVEGQVAVLRTEAEVQAARSRLARSMGVQASADWTVASGLAMPDTDAPELAAALTRARERRLDLQAAEREAEAIATAFRLTRRTRLLGEVELGYERTRESDRSRTRGPSVGLELPLFNWGAGRQARAEAQLAEAEAKLAGLLLDVDAEITAAHARMRTQRQLITRYQAELLPLTETLIDQMQREQNFMLIGVFELLAARRASYEVYEGYIAAVRDYWQSRVALGLAMGESLAPAPSAAAATLLPGAGAASPPARAHHGHGDHAADHEAPAQAPERGHHSHHGHPGHPAPAAPEHPPHQPGHGEHPGRAAPTPTPAPRPGHRH